MSAAAIRNESSMLPLAFGQDAEPYSSLRHAGEPTLPHLFAEQAAATPHALAAQCGSEQLTYAELDKRSNQLARYLQLLGVGPDIPVGLYVERSLDFVTGALAIMKAGGAYLPLDSAWPAERIAGVLRDAQAPVLLSHRWKPAGLPPGNWNTVDLDVCAPQIGALSAAPLRKRVTAEQLAYIIYTSGSTGQPKGVEITHGNLSTLIAWHTAEFAVSPRDRASQVAGLGFDAAVWEIWPSLAAGASLHIADEESRRSPESLRDWLVAQQITIAFVPTAMAETLIAEAWPPCKLTRLLTGGDALRRYPIPGLPFVLFNNYGPTECTVLVTSGLIRSAVDTAKSPSIGRPVSSAEVHILDENLLPVSPGAPGEICISGPRVGRGYRHRPELTAAKFVPNPFGDGLLYRTGDRARLLSSGEIDFLGRIDDQVKIRGYRIEPAEVIYALNRHPQICASLVIARDEALAAYLVFQTDTVLTASTLREFLSSTLPEYMIPALFINVKELPLTSSGKYDKAALPQPTAANTLPLHAPAISGATENETRLLRIVGALVGSDNISKDDNFFFIGGHSMLAAQLLVRIRKDFGVSLTLRQLFQAPTVAALCDSLQAVQERASRVE
jgi:amino acid adenylation domain-containing protein